MIDQTDLHILGYLKENARINSSEIGERVNMSVSAVIERIKKMETSGVIDRYTVLVDHKKLGMDVSAYISVSLEHPKYNDSFVEAMNRNPQVVECNYITGDFDFMLKVIAYSTDDLTELLGAIKTVPGISLTRTQLVLSNTKNEVTALPKSNQ